MSRIEKLIAELCPEGVEYKTLGDIVEFKRGTQLKPTNLVPGPYPVVTASRSENYSHSEWNYGPESVTVTSHGAYAGHVNFWSTPIWLANNVFLLVPNSALLPRYFFFVLKNDERRLQGTAQGGGVPYINVRDLAPLRIPIPPLEVQREIVKVLDTFTQLEAELEAELEARRRQYHHYRDALLNLSSGRTGFAKIDTLLERLCPEGVEFKALGDIAEIRSGWGFPNIHQGKSGGAYPFYKVSDMNLAGNETVMTVANNFIDEATVRKLGVTPAPAGTVIFPKIGAAVATNKKRLLSMPSAYDNNVMGLIPSNQINPRFLFFWMQTVDLSKLAHNSGAVPSIRKSEMELVLVPIPPLEVQREIVAILDRFDALVNDLTSGLPAEIEARRKQYQHYRGRLLTFQEKAAA